MKKLKMMKYRDTRFPPDTDDMEKSSG